MEDYGNFRLKKADELSSLLLGWDELLIVACNKCFKEFILSIEPECAEFAGFVAGRGVAVSGTLNVDFLCNKVFATRKISELLPVGPIGAGSPGGMGVTEGTGGTVGTGKPACVFVISCGLGVQTVADIVGASKLSGMPVYSACDSGGDGGRRGLALTRYRCEACAQCYLNYTGGICPISGCAKGLVNGACGGASGGKCEVFPDKDCAWEQIYKRQQVNAQAAPTAYVSEHAMAMAHTIPPVQIRDYSKAGPGVIGAYVKSIREKRLEGFYGGLHPPQSKDLTENLPLRVFALPQTVTLPLSQHTGAPALPLVRPGDRVKTGEKIGEADGYISAAVHASISGEVVAVEKRRHPSTGVDVLSVIIKSDGRDELHESVRPCPDWRALGAKEIIDIVRDKGITGMGGAGFPASVKLKPPKPVDAVLLNGCECEPYLNADHRVMIEYADDVITGLLLILRATGASRGIIVVENNKPDVIGLLRLKLPGVTGVEVFAATTKYPQGAEKMLIKTALGRHVPSGSLPHDVGAVVFNIATAKAVSDAVVRGLPPIERAVTVAGTDIGHFGNFIVRLGTPISDILTFCEFSFDGESSVAHGGPMMGHELKSYDVPVIKSTNGVIALRRASSNPSPCIRCGRCVDVCPMELLPLYYPPYLDSENWEGMRDKSVMDCVECGCCDHICSSKIPIRQTIKLGKKAIAEIDKAERVDLRNVNNSIKTG